MAKSRSRRFGLARWVLCCALVWGGLASAEGAEPLTWSLDRDLAADTVRENPHSDQADFPTWHFLRTTRAEGNPEQRRWLRDGRYTPLTESGERLFDHPFDGWIFQKQPAESPAITVAQADHAAGLAVKRGAVVLAPGPQHAVIVGWRSPVAGTLTITGAFEHAQASSGIAWHVERGVAPDLEQGFTPVSLAHGECRFGTPTQRAEFHLPDLAVQPGDFVYFVVDALADGTATPHYGDGTRLEVTLSIAGAEWPAPPTFETEVVPILARHCQQCHGDDPREAQLDLRSVSTLLRGGESGPAVVRGAPHQSLLIDLIQQGQMPPASASSRPSPEELAVLRRWIRAGLPARETVVTLPPHAQVTAEDRQFWAFQPPRKLPEPTVRQVDRVRNPIDAFLLARLEEQGLGFSPEADRRTLMRRLSFDLLGLPPEPAEVEAFLADPRPDAYEQLVDRLLQSPHYGERWARHWLDAAGYVDGKLDNDLATMYPSAGIWRYRDYVVRAFQQDRPYDRFLTEQLAGDELVDWRQADQYTPETRELLTATGFLRHVDDHTDFPQYGVEKRYEVLNETLDMVSTAVLGLTLECCRCHNHKYDPLPQRDYYRLMACFEPAFNVHAWKPPKDRTLPDVPPAVRDSIDRHNAALDQQLGELTKQEGAVRAQARQRVVDARLAALPESIRADVQAALQTAADQRNEVQKYLAGKFANLPQVADPEVEQALAAEERTSLQTLASQKTQLAGQKQSYGLLQALWDVGPVPVSRVHRRGNPKTQGVLVQPGFPEILEPAGQPTAVTTAGAVGATSGRRLALAQWLTRPEHPLTARVWVNRVWHHHFGRGLVETLGNFGRSGGRPSHPELLDWLAVDFVEHGWSTRRLHRQLVLSSAYRQSSRRPALEARPVAGEPNPEEIDPDNRLLWRMNLRRLEAEVVRDALLAATGTLDTTAGGPPVEITAPADGLSEIKGAAGPEGAERRSLYLFARRVYPLKFLEIFDAPIMPVNCTQRMNSATVLQSLALLNSDFVRGRAMALATRVSGDATPAAHDPLPQVWQRVLGRPPGEKELREAAEFLAEQQAEARGAGVAERDAARSALADLIQMLLSSNEFLYVE